MAKDSKTIQRAGLDPEDYRTILELHHGTRLPTDFLKQWKAQKGDGFVVILKGRIIMEKNSSYSRRK